MTDDPESDSKIRGLTMAAALAATGGGELLDALFPPAKPPRVKTADDEAMIAAAERKRQRKREARKAKWKPR